MESTGFDHLARRFATRRRTIQATVAGVAAGLLGGISTVPEVAAKPAKRCGKNEQRCDGKCIKSSQCCTARDCTGAKAGACRRKRCRPAFKTCVNQEAALSYVKRAPGNPPLSKGAVKFVIEPENPTIENWAHIRSSNFAGKAITDIESLKYSVWVANQPGDVCPADRPYPALYVTASGTDQILVFAGGSESFGCEEWGTIDAALGRWWMPFRQDFAPLSDPKTLAEIEAEFPGTTIRNALTTDAQCPTALGGLRLEAGEWAGSDTDDIVIFVSYLTVGIDGETTTFRF